MTSRCRPVWFAALLAVSTASIAIGLDGQAAQMTAGRRRNTADTAQATPVPRVHLIAAAEALYSVPMPRTRAQDCRFFVDEGGRRVLLSTPGGQSGDGTYRLYWLVHRRLVPTRLAGVTHDPEADGPYAVDFRHGWVYLHTGWTHGSPTGLVRVQFGGGGSQVLPDPDDSMAAGFVIPRTRGDRVDVIGESAFGGAVVFSSYRGLRSVRHEALARRPEAALYAAQPDRLFLVYGSRVKEWHGNTAFALPRLPAATDSSYADFAWAMDITPDGAYVYYADPQSRVISKIRVLDGAAVTRRRVDFTPAALAVQGTTGRLLLAGVGSHSRRGDIDTIYVIKGF